MSNSILILSVEVAQLLALQPEMLYESVRNPRKPDYIVQKMQNNSMLNDSSLNQYRPSTKAYHSSLLGGHCMPTQGPFRTKRTTPGFQSSFDKENHNLSSYTQVKELGLEEFQQPLRRSAHGRSYLKRKASQSVKKNYSYTRHHTPKQTLNGFKLRLQMRIESVSKKSRGGQRDKQELIAEIDDNQRVLIRSVEELQKLKERLSQDSSVLKIGKVNLATNNRTINTKYVNYSSLRRQQKLKL